MNHAKARVSQGEKHDVRVIMYLTAEEKEEFDRDAEGFSQSDFLYRTWRWAKSRKTRWWEEIR